MAARRGLPARLCLRLALGVAALSAAQVALAQLTTYSPIAVYEGATGTSALVTSVQKVGAAFQVEVIQGTLKVSATAKTHIIRAYELAFNQALLNAMAAAVNKPGSMLVLLSSAGYDYNAILSPFLGGQSPNCEADLLSKAANLQFLEYSATLPLSLFTGSQAESYVCAAGTQWYSTNDGRSPLYIFKTPNGGIVKLIGYDYFDSLRQSQYEKLLLFATGSPVVEASPPPRASSPPPRPPPSPKANPSPGLVPEPREPGEPTAFPNPRAPRAPAAPKGEANVIILTDARSPSDSLRKTQLKTSIISVFGSSNVIARADQPGDSAIHVIYDNTYSSLSSGSKSTLKDKVKNARTVLSIVVTPETSQSTLSNILSDVIGANVNCLKRVMGPKEDMAAAPFSDFSNVNNIPRFSANMNPRDNTIGLSCDRGRQLLLVADHPLEAAMWEFAVGSGIVRLVGYDFTSGGWTSSLKDVSSTMRLPSMATVAVTWGRSMLPPAPPFSTPSPPQPPTPPPGGKFPGGRIPRVAFLTDRTAMSDAAAKSKLVDGVTDLGNAPGESSSPIDGSLVHVGYDTTLAAMDATTLNTLADMVQSKKTILSVVVTAGVSDTQRQTLLAKLTGASSLGCVSGTVPENGRVQRQIKINGDLRSDGWRAMADTRYVRCNLGQNLFAVNLVQDQAVILEMPTVGGGIVRLVGYNFMSGGRGDNRKPVTSLTVFAAALVTQKPVDPSEVLPPLPGGLRSPPSPPPPRGAYKRPPRPPGARLPPRPTNFGPLGPYRDAILITDLRPPTDKKDLDRKQKLLKGLRELKGYDVVGQPNFGNAPVHIIFDNTYQRLTQSQKYELLTRVLIWQTFLVVIVTPGTRSNALATIAMESTGLDNVRCSKEGIQAGARFKPSPGLLTDVVGPWRSSGGTSAINCYGSSPVYQTFDRNRPVIIEFFGPGAATVRFVGDDFSAGARGAGRVGLTKLLVWPQRLTGVPKPSPPPRLPPVPKAPRSPRGPGAAQLPNEPPFAPQPPDVPHDLGALLVALIVDPESAVLPAVDSARKEIFRVALDQAEPGRVAITVQESYPSIGVAMAFDNTLGRSTFTQDKKDELFNDIDLGNTVMNVMVTPLVSASNTVLTNIVRQLGGWPSASCTKTAAVAAPLRLTKFSDVARSRVPNVLEMGNNAMTIACTGVPDDFWRPIYVNPSNQVIVVEVITANYGILRLVGYDFSSATEASAAEWMKTLTYNLRISEGAPVF
ncbi:hypothetical protein HYH03_005797 [Edaphochlamys debaryana]|uniref:VWFA domain-containing protein n=1 Tax=Edaphochlamys debaryana TaxID=47281 RepID=A0A836C216_9CHLO|nr:hypothetical protein HYH03_005797 [Edaphochlamys debaryana]|eukprot:KAG2496198.1 hypothetical protein HYH03_005797 [Edaphochlamys debaryana]